jgi:hypothetical protein
MEKDLESVVHSLVKCAEVHLVWLQNENCYIMEFMLKSDSDAYLLEDEEINPQGDIDTDDITDTNSRLTGSTVDLLYP